MGLPSGLRTIHAMFGHLLRRGKPAGPGPGEGAPDFTLAALEGGCYTLSSALERAPQVIAFFKVSCSTCQFTFPFLERLHRAYGSEGIEFRGISQDDGDKTRQFRERFGVTFPMAIDGESYQASRRYHFSHVPTILLIGSDGKIRFRLSGFSKAGLVELSGEIGRVVGRAAAPVFLAGEVVPEWKPG